MKFGVLFALIFAACASTPKPVAVHVAKRVEQPIELPDTSSGKSVDELVDAALNRPTEPTRGLVSTFSAAKAYRSAERCEKREGDSICGVTYANERTRTSFVSVPRYQAEQSLLVEAALTAKNMRTRGTRPGRIMTAGAGTQALFAFKSSVNGRKSEGLVNIRRVGDVTVMTIGIWTSKNRVRANRDFNAYVLQLDIAPRTASR